MIVQPIVFKQTIASRWNSTSNAGALSYDAKCFRVRCKNDQNLTLKADVDHWNIYVLWLVSCRVQLWIGKWHTAHFALNNNQSRVPTQFSKPNSMTFHDFSMTFSMTFVTLFPCVFKWYLHVQTGNSLIKNSWCHANGIQLSQTCSRCISCVGSQNQTNIAININQLLTLPNIAI